MVRQKLTERLEALATMSPAQLHDQWRLAFRDALPQVAPNLLRRLLAQGLQERQLGRLPPEIKRKLLGIADGKEISAPQPTVTISTGTRFIREWQGRSIEVVAVDGGFEWKGRKYGSLSRIAREVTGTHQSGPRFFGLKGRGGHV